MRIDSIGSGESKLETMLSYLLIAGVIISLCLEVFGIILFFHSYSNLNLMLSDKSMFIKGQNFFTFLYKLGKGEGVPNSAILFMTLGAAILILTPYLRVIISFTYFAWRRDTKYIFITAFVLVIITISLMLNKAI